MNKLVLANLIHRPMRSVISAAAIAIEVVMIISVAAIFLGQIDGQKIRTNGIGADMIVRPANASFINAVGGAPIPAKNVEVMRKLPHVAVASPVIQSFNLTGGPEILFGIDYTSYNALRPFTFIEGTPFQGPNDVIVDDVFAHTSKTGYHAGDTIQILNHPFRICGIVEAGKGGRKMIPIATLGELIGSEGKASQFFLKTDNEANEDTVRQALHGLDDVKLAGAVRGSDSRVTKYEHRFSEAFNFGRREVAILCVLLLRGPQTPGELRGRTDRLHPFDELSDVQSTLQRLIDFDPPFVKVLPRQPGTKESRYAHLFCGDNFPQPSESERHSPADSANSEDAIRLQLLEEQVAKLTEEVAELRAQVAKINQIIQ